MASHLNIHLINHHKCIMHIQYVRDNVQSFVYDNKLCDDDCLTVHYPWLFGYYGYFLNK